MTFRTIRGAALPAGSSPFRVVDQDGRELEWINRFLDMQCVRGRDELLYTTPDDLAPLRGTRRERQVWVRQLIRFEPATGKSTAITSGVTNNLDASL